MRGEEILDLVRTELDQALVDCISPWPGYDRDILLRVEVDTTGPEWTWKPIEFLGFVEKGGES